MSSTSKTQRGQILARLIEAGNRGVPSFEMGGIALQYSARVKELRDLGHRIVCDVKVVNGQRRGTFRLIPEKPISKPPASTAAMFDRPIAEFRGGE